VGLAGWLCMYVCMYVCSLVGFQFSGRLAWVGGWLLKVVCGSGVGLEVFLGGFGGFGRGGGALGKLGGGFFWWRWMEFVGCLFWLCCVVGVGLGCVYDVVG